MVEARWHLVAARRAARLNVERHCPLGQCLSALNRTAHRPRAPATRGRGRVWRDSRRGRHAFEQHVRGIGIAQDRAERLVDLVRDRRGEFADDRKPRCMRVVARGLRAASPPGTAALPPSRRRHAPLGHVLRVHPFSPSTERHAGRRATREQCPLGQALRAGRNPHACSPAAAAKASTSFSVRSPSLRISTERDALTDFGRKPSDAAMSLLFCPRNR